MKSILGIKEATVRPYNDVINFCLRLGAMLSSLIFKVIIEAIKPIENTQNKILMLFLNGIETNAVMEPSQ
ncbi:hypothetical protein [Lacinutrix sp. Hel_I_90]|uniref:hypothetical protein n=1 Tax=Lacinutrix sp. Hel_I_90 TaxID=1249999 RepID=UPI001E47A795|nr:hypothetical protein [Lacinutrix sp. Hel_I_90]